MIIDPETNIGSEYSRDVTSNTTAKNNSDAVMSIDIGNWPMSTHNVSGLDEVN